MLRAVPYPLENSAACPCHCTRKICSSPPQKCQPSSWEVCKEKRTLQWLFCLSCLCSPDLLRFCPGFLQVEEFLSISWYLLGYVGIRIHHTVKSKCPHLSFPCFPISTSQHCRGGKKRSKKIKVSEALNVSTKYLPRYS